MYTIIIPDMPPGRRRQTPVTWLQSGHGDMGGYQPSRSTEYYGVQISSPVHVQLPTPLVCETFHPSNLSQVMVRVSLFSKLKDSGGQTSPDTDTTWHRMRVPECQWRFVISLWIGGPPKSKVNWLRYPNYHTLIYNYISLFQVSVQRTD